MSQKAMTRHVTPLPGYRAAGAQDLIDRCNGLADTQLLQVLRQVAPEELATQGTSAVVACCLGVLRNSPRSRRFDQTYRCFRYTERALILCRTHYGQDNFYAQTF